MQNVSEILSRDIISSTTYTAWKKICFPYIIVNEHNTWLANYYAQINIFLNKFNSFINNCIYKTKC